jgi:hypothetical protein
MIDDRENQRSVKAYLSYVANKSGASEFELAGLSGSRRVWAVRRCHVYLPSDSANRWWFMCTFGKIGAWNYINEAFQAVLLRKGPERSTA